MKRVVALLSLVAVLVVGTLAYAGASGGPVRFYRQRVPGGDVKSADVRFSGGEWAEVEMDIHGSDRDLDLVILDQDGNVVAEDYHNRGGDGYVRWYVPYGQTYTIVIWNWGFDDDAIVTVYTN